MRTAFVTGATGFVGTNLVHALVADGWDVTVLHRPTSDIARIASLPLRRVIGTIDDEAALLSAIPEGVDAVFHVAANTSLWRRRDAEQIHDNIVGTRCVARAALARCAKRFIHTSSIAAFGHHEERIDESAVSNAADSSINYVRTKHMAELEVETVIDGGLNATFLNPAHIIGRYDDNNWSRLFTLVKNRKLPAIPPGRGSFCDVREVARAHITAVDRGRTGDRYLLGGADATFREMINIIAELTGTRPPTRTAPPFLLKTVAFFQEVGAMFTGREPEMTREGATIVSETVLCDSSKAERALGYRPVPLREMLEDCYRWMKSEGRI